ncbi:MAG: hypothetical protein LBE91_19925 [Tannerella sp.]|nr:hypothetical protein [Tannerella sp.]
MSKSLKTILVLAASMLLIGAVNQQNSNGLFKNSGDIGNPKLKGIFEYNPDSKVYTLTGGGTNMWMNSDEFFMAWKQMTGDFAISARVVFDGEGVNAHRKIGVIIRESLTGESKYADVALHGDGLTSLQYRDTTGGITREVTAKSVGCKYLTLERTGRKITMKVSNSGFSTISAGEIELDLPATCYAGIFICSHDADVLEKAFFTDVQLQSSPKSTGDTKD